MTHQNSPQPPWDFLLSASRNSLQSYELSRLTYAANVRKEIVQLLDVYIAESSNAALARLLMEQREQPAPEPVGSRERSAVGATRGASDNFLEEQGLPKARTRPPE